MGGRRVYGEVLVRYSRAELFVSGRRVVQSTETLTTLACYQSPALIWKGRGISRSASDEKGKAGDIEVQGNRVGASSPPSRKEEIDLRRVWRERQAKSHTHTAAAAHARQCSNQDSL